MKKPRSYAVFADEHEEDLLYLETDKVGHTIFATKSGIYRFHNETDTIDGSVFRRLVSYFEKLGPTDPEGNHLRIQALVMEGEKKIEEKPQAYWEYWGGWAGNHDKRIDDAKCSNCGFKHPTVRGGNAPDQLYKLCPHCGRHMGHKEV